MNSLPHDLFTTAAFAPCNPAILAAGLSVAVPYAIRPGGAQAPLLLVCDHASPHIPLALEGLGVAAADQVRHIGWDIGAAALTHALAARLDCPAVLAGVSRLVVDCNRAPTDATLICGCSDQTEIPGNHGLDPDAVEQRLSAYWTPYHDAIDACLAALSPQTAIIAIHSFTPRMNGFDRPWHVGVLWNQDDRLAAPVLAGLAAEAGLCVGDNQPYSGRVANYTVDRHGQDQGRPHVSLEIRQDLLADHAGVNAWADRLERLMRPLLIRS